MDQGDTTRTSGTIREKLVETKRRWPPEGRLPTGRPSNRQEVCLPPGQRKATEWPVLDLGAKPNIPATAITEIPGPGSAAARKYRSGSIERR